MDVNQSYQLLIVEISCEWKNILILSVTFVVVFFFRDYENQSEEPTQGWFSSLASMVNQRGFFYFKMQTVGIVKMYLMKTFV